MSHCYPAKSARVVSLPWRSFLTKPGRLSHTPPSVLRPLSSAVVALVSLKISFIRNF